MLTRLIKIAALSAAAPAVHAATLDPGQLLSEFNAVVLNDMVSSVNHVEGTVYVGGNLTSNSAFYANNRNLADGTVDTISGALIVGGDINGGLNDGGAGDIVVGGSVTGTVSTNSAARLTEGVAGIAVGDVATALTSLSTELSLLADTPGAGVSFADPNRKSLTSGAGGVGSLEDIAVFNLNATDTISFLTGGTLASLNLDVGVTTILNLAGDDIELTTSFNQDESSVLFNFFEATNLQINNTFGFSVLSPFADVILGPSGGMDGTLVANNLDQRVELRPYGTVGVFDGSLPETSVSPVPLPASAALLIAALVGLGLVRRKVT